MEKFILENDQNDLTKFCRQHKQVELKINKNSDMTDEIIDTIALLIENGTIAKININEKLSATTWNTFMQLLSNLKKPLNTLDVLYGQEQLLITSVKNGAQLKKEEIQREIFNKNPRASSIKKATFNRNSRTFSINSGNEVLNKQQIPDKKNYVEKNTDLKRYTSVPKYRLKAILESNKIKKIHYYIEKQNKDQVIIDTISYSGCINCCNIF